MSPLRRGLLRGMVRPKKPLRDFRHTSFRLEKELLTDFIHLCAKIGISYSTGLRWLIQDAVQKQALKLPSMPEKESKIEPKDTIGP